jgi:hypothetical protein
MPHNTYETAMLPFSDRYRLLAETGQRSLGVSEPRRLEMDSPRLSAVVLAGATLLPAALPAGAGETAIDVNTKATAKLPFGGVGVKQVSGLSVSVGADGNFTAPGDVCTLIFQKGDQRAVVRVWENKDHRYFVSYANGDDASPGTEQRPFKTLAHAYETVQETDPDGDIYCPAGDHVIEMGRGVIFKFKVSLYGGFDEEAGWRRDPVIQQRVLLPDGFRRNWVDDMCDRFKDLRRTDHRCHETRIWSSYEPASLGFPRGKVATIGFGGNRGPGKEGTPDTYVDGLTFFGCNQTGLYQPGFADVGPVSVRTVRHCIFVMFWNNGHAFMPGGGGRGLWENNIFWGGIVGHQGHARPQMVYRGGATMRRNLHVGATGGDYNRMFLCWEEGGLVTESQIHGGNPPPTTDFGWTTAIQVHHGAQVAEKDYRFINNEILADHLANPAVGSGLVMEGNRFLLLKGGFNGELTMWRTLTIRDNDFHVAPQAKVPIIPESAKTLQLGGKWLSPSRNTEPKFIPPADGQYRQPIVEGNCVTTDPAVGRRPANHVDVVKLSGQVREHGEEAALRPKDPAKKLRATVIGPDAVKLTWEPSKDRDVVGYRVYYGPKPNSYANTHAVVGKTETEIEDLKPGRWYFSVAAHKEAFVECWQLSNEVAVEVEG